MTAPEIAVIGGIDTHTDVHQAAVIDSVGRHLDTQPFETNLAGYEQLLAWLRAQGEVIAVGMEGTGAYGAELARFLTANGITVVEVDRPDRRARRAHGKSDPIDAYAAATAVLSGRASGTPKSRDGIVEAIGALRVVRRAERRHHNRGAKEDHSCPIGQTSSWSGADAQRKKWAARRYCPQMLGTGPHPRTPYRHGLARTLSAAGRACGARVGRTATEAPPGGPGRQGCGRDGLGGPGAGGGALGGGHRPRIAVGRLGQIGAAGAEGTASCCAHLCSLPGARSYRSTIRHRPAQAPTCRTARTVTRCGPFIHPRARRKGGRQALHIQSGPMRSPAACPRSHDPHPVVRPGSPDSRAGPGRGQPRLAQTAAEAGCGSAA
ncbi:transposase [Streptomyces sp. NPDC057235]|uniref:IS110 family transposase n=1 Tax=Streptomyces sp. NPDC057235 TaxID=3346058 RepID=UPI0036353CCC